MNIEDSAAGPPIAPPVPVRALVVLVLGLLATWLAAGALGWIAPPLQKGLTWLTFAAIVITALPTRRVSGTDVALLGGATSIALLFTASSTPAINILAVAILLAAIAQFRPGPFAQVPGPVALAAMTLAVYRFVSAGSAAAWTFSNGLGHMEGTWAGWLTGRPLLIGATFGGVDFLVVMVALAIARQMTSPGSRLAQPCKALMFILLAQTVYLVILAYSDELAALLPPQETHKYDRLSHLGIWTWYNAIRSLLPWNVPLVAAVLHSGVAVGMFGLGGYAAPDDRQAKADEPPPPEGKRRNRTLQGLALALDTSRPRPSWQWLPAGLLMFAAIAMTYMSAPPDLKNRHIVAYDDGATDWSTADPGTVPPGNMPRYGLLKALVESLGGDFIHPRDLTEADLRAADVLIVLPPKSAASATATVAPPAMPEDLRDRIWRYVADGGRLIVAADPETALRTSENSLNELLQPTKMWFRDDTANSLTERWEDNLQAAPHTATASSEPGQGYFSFDRAASIRVAWPAGPLVVGRWAWDEVGTDPERPEALPYSPGNHLGDLVLAAQQNFGQGTVVTLNAAACLSNDGIPFSYRFTGPLLSALAAKASTPLAWWRQFVGIAAAAAAIVLLFPTTLRAPQSTLGVAAAALTLAATTWACVVISNVSGQLLPSGNKSSPRPIIYVDGSHLEGMGKDPWGDNGIGRLMRILADNGYLPLIAPDVSPDRLKQAAMLISIAPGKPFNSYEIAAVKQFIIDGGFFLSMVGSPDAEPSRPLLEELNLHIEPMPLPPSERDRETTPNGPYRYPNDDDGVEFYAAWPVTGEPGAVVWPADDPDPLRKPVLAGNKIGSGQAFLLGDSAFALKKNFEEFSHNPGFWERSLKAWLGHEPPRPPASPPTIGPKNANSSNTGAIPGLPKTKDSTSQPRQP
jgi:hypothetical protein